MTELEGYTFYDSAFFYITNPSWKHTERGFRARNNLIFVTDGTVYFEENGIQYEVKSGECLLMDRQVAGHGYRSSGDTVSFFSVVFECSKVPDFPKHFSVANTDFVQHLFTQLVQCTGRHDYPSYAIDNLMRALFYELLYQSEFRSKHQGLPTEDIKNWVYKNRYRNPTVQDVAWHFHFCADHASRLFRQHEHISLKDYIISVKISLINNLLGNQVFEIKRVAELAGFPNESSLCKFYKYHTGMTPSEYRIGFYTGIQRQKRQENSKKTASKES